MSGPFFDRLSAQDVVSFLKEDENEVLRYLGYSKKDLIFAQQDKKGIVDDTTLSLVRSSISEMRSALKCQGVYTVFDLRLDGNQIEFADISFESESLSRNLHGCSKVSLLAATIGPAVDLLIKRATKLDTAKAAVMQATGAMFIETYVDYLNEKISQNVAISGFKTKPRFSPGYGDVPLSIQKDFFRLLPCTQKLGLTLMDSLIMAPEKSVTAFIGIKSN